MPLTSLESETDKGRGGVTGNGGLMGKRPSDSVSASPAKPKALENLLSKRNGSDSGHHSQQSLNTNGSANVPQINLPPEMLDPGAKDILATCARYNLDQGIAAGGAEEILEEIRHAETMEAIRSSKSTPTSPTGGVDGAKGGSKGRKKSKADGSSQVRSSDVPEPTFSELGPSRASG